MAKELLESVKNPFIERFINRLEKNYNVYNEKVYLMLAVSEKNRLAFKKVIDIYTEMIGNTNYDPMEYIFRNNLLEYVELLDEESYMNNLSLDSFYKSFNEIRNIKNWNKSRLLLNQYINDNLRDNYPISDMNDYCNAREQYILSKPSINNSDISNTIQIYYKISYSKFEKFILSLESLNLKYKFIKDYNLYQEFKSILFIKDKNTYLDYINNIDKYLLYYKKLKIMIREYSKIDMIRSLKNPYKEKEIIEFKGQDFAFLIHAISGLEDAKLAMQMVENISLWEKSNKGSLYISCCLLDNNHIASVDRYNLMFLGFNKLTMDRIVTLAPHDTFTLNSDVDTRKGLCKSEWMLTEQMLKETKMYNEIAIKRRIEGKIINPDYILSIDKISNNERKAQQYFQIPIYLLYLDSYIEKTLKRVEYLKNHDQEEYYEYLNFLNIQVNKTRRFCYEEKHKNIL